GSPEPRAHPAGPSNDTARSAMRYRSANGPALRTLSLTLMAALTLASCARQTPQTTTETSTTQTRTVQVSHIDLGNSLTSDRRVITTSAPSFAPKDTVYASVILAAPVPAAQVTARWTAPDGAVVSETTQTVAASPGEGVAQFQVATPDGLPPGNYKLEILVDGQVVSTKDFTIAST